MSAESIERAKRNVASAEWAKKWFEGQKEIADYVVSRPEGYADRLISETTPGNTYGFTCPNCVGKKSQEGEGISLVSWDYRDPDVIACRKCGQRYPDAKYPETGRILCPRSGQELTYYVNDAERKHGVERDCQYSWRWVGFPIHPTFSGIIRHHKAGFAVAALGALSHTYALTDDPRYAKAGASLLKRLAKCYRGWLYHDYWDTVADCDPIYAAWHASELPRAWKLHPCDSAFAKDTPEKASMLQASYWGAGRLGTSTDSVSVLDTICIAYELFRAAREPDGSPTITDDARNLIERDLILEWIIGAEPFVGGEGKADATNNKTPRVYQAMAAVGKCLGIPAYVDVALRGYEGIRDGSFLYDGFSRESPSYTNMYLGGLLPLIEMLDGYTWPAGTPGRSGTISLYSTDQRLRLMMLAQLDQLRPSGDYIPLSDTTVGGGPGAQFIETGLKRYPKEFGGMFRALLSRAEPSRYAVYELDSTDIEKPGEFAPPEILFPAWMTAILRHGEGSSAAMASLAFNPTGGHRHADNLALYYVDGGHVMLDDLGYVGDMPVNEWIRDTASHNLVMVDGSRQKTDGRIPRLRMMATSPRVSVVEASSDAYPQCSDYRRVVALVKEPEGHTFLVDIFRVKGGGRHEYRALGGLASSDDAKGSLVFEGLDMPPEPPLEVVGQSLAREDIYGLRGIRSCDSPPAMWSATWKGSDRSLRLWMASEADVVQGASGPAQTGRKNAGRRGRYVNVVREGSDLQSTFAAVYEPSTGDESLRIRRIERRIIPEVAGPDAVALRVVSGRGTYLMLSDFAEEAEVDGVRFHGRFGVVFEGTGGERWSFAVGASTLRKGPGGLKSAPATWSGRCTVGEGNVLKVAKPRPAGWRETPEGCRSWVNVHDGSFWTGFPVSGTEEQRIAVERFPVPAEASEFELLSVFFQE